MPDNNLSLNVSVESGKYTVQMTEDGKLSCLRYGEPWRDLTGDKMVLALAQEIEMLRTRLTLSNTYLKTEWKNNRLHSGMSWEMIENLNKSV